MKGFVESLIEGGQHLNSRLGRLLEKPSQGSGSTTTPRETDRARTRTTESSGDGSARKTNRWKAVGLGSFGVFAGLLGWQFVGYPLAMGLYARIADSDTPSDVGDTPSRSMEQPFVTVIVPSYNEAGVVAKRVSNLRTQTYPSDRYEVLFVDSGSTDGTAAVLRAALRDLGPDDPPMELLEQPERSGKASAINHGVARGRGEVVLVTDANTVFAPETIERVTPHFADPTVGAVAGRLAVLETESSLTASNQFYRDLEHMKAIGESPLDSVCQFVGELSAWRAGIVEANEASLAEDLDLSVCIRKQGYRIVYEPRALVYESEPDTVAEQVASKKRRVIGTIQVLMRHWYYLLVPGDAYRAVVFPSRKALLVFSPFLCVGTVLCFLVTLAAAPWTALGVAFVTAALGTGTFGALLALRNRLLADERITDGSNTVTDDPNRNTPPTDGTVGLRDVLAVVRYVAVIEYTILLAWRDFLGGEYSVRWQKSTSDRR